MSNILNGITEAKRSPEPDYNDPSWDNKVSNVGQKAKQAEVLKSKGKEPKTRWNPETKKYYVDFSDDVKNESVGLPYPGTYEETDDMFKGSGQRRIGTLTNEQEISEAGTRAGALNSATQLKKEIEAGQGKRPQHEIDNLRRMMNALMRKYKINPEELNSPQSSQQRTQPPPPPGGQQQPPGGQQGQQSAGPNWWQQASQQQPPPPPGAQQAHWNQQMNQQYGFPQQPNAADPNWFNQHMAASNKMAQANTAALNQAANDTISQFHAMPQAAKMAEEDEHDAPFRGAGGAFNRGDNERHDLDLRKKNMKKQGMAEGSDRIAANKQDRVDALENKLKAKGYARTKDSDGGEYQYRWTRDGAPSYVVNYRSGANGYAEFWKEQGVAEGEGNYAGDRPVNLGGVSMKMIQTGDTVKYIDQKAQVVDMSPDRKYSRITIPSSSTTKTVLTSDLRQLGQGMAEGWSQKYKKSINCSHPKGFSQKAHCAGKKKHNESVEMEMVCEDCGMCETHCDHENLDEACWKGYHKEGNKKMFGKTYPNCVKNEGVAEEKRIPRKSGQPANSKKHSDLYTDENPKGTIHGLKFATPEDAHHSVAKIKSSGASHAHKIQAAVAMEQRAKAAGKSSAAAVYRAYINSTKKIKEDVAEEKKPEFMKAGNMKPFKVSGEEIPGAVHTLEKLLLKAKERDIELNYTNIDKMMQAVCKKHNLTGDELHNEFVEKHHMIPDDWIVKQLDEACWSTHKQVGMKNKGGKQVPNCVPKESVEEQHSDSCPHCGGEMVSEELMNEKKDACYYKVKSRYKVWPSAYASGALVKCRKKGADSWGNGGKKNESSILEGIGQVDESLHDWFTKEKWVRMDTKGNIKGPCAREPGEGKPKCLPQAKAHSLGKKGRASAAARKRREDPNPERHGPAINVNTKKK
jgi:hypothetical protein